MTKKDENKPKTTSTTQSSKKEILYELMQESQIEEHKKVGALGKAGLLDQYEDEKTKYGRFDIEPSITKDEFEKILKDFLG